MENEKNKFNMERIYISGPISGYDPTERENVFSKAERYILDNGNIPINPLRNGLSPNFSHQIHMRVDIANLLQCDAIYMLEGWDNSKGCKIEHQVAEACGIRVIYK